VSHSTVEYSVVPLSGTAAIVNNILSHNAVWFGKHVAIIISCSLYYRFLVNKNCVCKRNKSAYFISLTVYNAVIFEFVNMVITLYFLV